MAITLVMFTPKFSLVKFANQPVPKTLYISFFFFFFFFFFGGGGEGRGVHLYVAVLDTIFVLTFFDSIFFSKA